MRSWAAVRSSSVTRRSASEMTGPSPRRSRRGRRGRRRGPPRRRGRPRRRGARVVRRGHGRSRKGEDGHAAHERRAAQRCAGSPGEEGGAQEQRQGADCGGRAEAGGEEVLGADGLRLLEDGRPGSPRVRWQRPGEDRVAVHHEPGGEDRARRSGQGDGRPGHLHHGGDGEEPHHRVVARVAAGCRGMDQAGGRGGRRREHQPRGRGPDGGGGAGGRCGGVGRGRRVVEVAVGGRAVVHLDSQHDFRCCRKGASRPMRHRLWSEAFFVTRRSA